MMPKRLALRFSAATILVFLMSFSLISVLAEQNTQAVFGEIHVFDLFNGKTPSVVVGEWALVTAKKDLMTDDVLIEFYKTHIKDSGHNWFVIDFGDGTGYFFAGSSCSFDYIYQQADDWRQSDDVMELGLGFIWEFENRVEYHFDPIKVPILSAVDEYRKWTDQNGIKLELLNESYEEVENGKGIVEIWDPVVYEGDTLTIIVK